MVPLDLLGFRRCNNSPISPQASREVVELRVGDEHPIRLAGLGTAGYRWTSHVEGDPGVAEVIPVGADAPAGAAVGASADELFTLRALRPGATQVRFARRRPWEAEDRPRAGEHIVELRVAEAG